MSGVFTTWVIGETIIIVRVARAQRRPPTPGELLGSSGLFVMLGLLAQWQPALATLLGAGFDVAAFMNLFAAGPLPKLAPLAPAGGSKPATPQSAPQQQQPAARRPVSV